MKWYHALLFIGIGFFGSLIYDHLLGIRTKECLPVEYDTIEMDVSAYCKDSCCTGRFSDGITASGKPAKGFLVAAPPSYPFGTLMDIPGYGIAEVQDRGGAIKGNKIDLLFDTHKQALEWGRQYLKVKVYK